jgi:peptidoglycan glycosyltransferase
MVRSSLNAWRQWSRQALEDRQQPRDRRESWLLAAAAAFLFSNALAYSLAREGAVFWQHFQAPAVWLAVMIVAHFVLRAFRPRRDPLLLPVFALLVGWGLLLQDRLAPNFLGRQTLWMVLSTAALLVVAVAPRTLQPLRRYRYVLLVGGLALLAITLIFGVNPSGSGAALWLPVPFPFLGLIYFQPSELLKLLLVIFLAGYFTEREPLYRYHKEARNGNGGRASFLARHLPFLGPLLLMWGFAVLLLVWQKDLGGAALFFVVFIGMVYVATGEMLYVWSGFALLMAAGLLAFFAFDTVVAARVLSWLNPWPNASDRAYQIVQALYAQAAGGVLGQGIGQGYPDFIPVVHSDFALAAIAEEWGLVGSVVVIACFAALAARGMRMALLAIRGARPNYFHAYLAVGLITLFSVQSFLIMGGVTRILPLTGVTLPFVSYGGSSLLISSLAVGLLLFLSADAELSPPAPSHDPELARRAGRLGVIILAGFGLVALTMSFWGVARSAALLAREDNPRLVEAEQRLARGRILDRRGRPLAESIPSDDSFVRVYPVAGSGPSVGYYSLRFGTAGIESAYDAHLRGRPAGFTAELIQRLLHLPVTGDDVRLTLDAEQQREATAFMTESGATGGLVLLEVGQSDDGPMADVRAMVSLPGYDPNRIDAEFDALTADDPGPLFDRAAQGLYQPGLVLQSFVLAAALDSGVVSLDEGLVDAFLPVTLNGQVQRCAIPRVEGDRAAYTWDDMGVLTCPAPLQALGEQLGAAALAEIFTRFGLMEAPPLPIPTEGGTAVIANPSLAAIGQETLTITPLQAALATAALAGDGRLPRSRLVEALADDGRWMEPAAGEATAPRPVVSPEAAKAVRESWPVEGGVAGQAVSVLAGPGGNRNTWFVGLAPADDPRFALAVVVEDEDDPAVAEAIGRAVLDLALREEE